MTTPTVKFVQALTLFSLLALAFCGCGRERGISGQIPSVTLKTLDGADFTLEGQGKDATLLVFWATWCGPCLMEIPSLVELHAKYKGKNFRVVSINLDDPEGLKAGAIAKEYGINYPVLLGTEETGKLFGGIVALPTSFLVGRDGRIKDKIQGLMPEEEMNDRIKRLLEGPG